MTVKRTPKPPGPIVVSDKPITPVEQWYLDCFRLLAKHLKRSPTIPELARYCDRAVFPTWEALCRLEAKGKLTRGPRRRFVEAGA